MATKAEKAWMDAIVDHGCVCCKMLGRPKTPAMVHHIVKGWRRMGHLFTIPLCYGHHHAGRYDDDFVSIHPYKARWEKLFGKELDILAKLQEEINGTD